MYIHIFHVQKHKHVHVTVTVLLIFQKKAVWNTQAFDLPQWLKVPLGTGDPKGKDPASGKKRNKRARPDPKGEEAQALPGPQGKERARPNNKSKGIVRPDAKAFYYYHQKL